MRSRVLPGRRAVRCTPVALAAGTAFAVLSVPSPGAVSPPTGTLRIVGTFAFRSADPAADSNPFTAMLHHTTCAKLFTYPERGGRAGTRLVPEVARALPRRSRDGRTYTFTLSRDFRFHTGERVTAAHFAYAINRILRLSPASPALPYVEDVVGARAVVEGRRPTAVGVRARGNVLSIRLARRLPDFPARLAAHYFCAVPLGFPAAPGAVPASAGPYYIAEWQPAARVVLRRNPFYRGSRLRRATQIAYALGVSLDAVALQVERGEADVGFPAPASHPEIVRRYGVNRERFFAAPSLRTATLALNTARPLFRNNARLRRAVNFAVDRPALARLFGGIARGTTDQYLSHAMPGFRDARIYPLHGPDVRRARRLAAGRTRSGTAVMYTANPTDTARSRAQIVQRDLARIGIEVEVRIGSFVPPASFFTPEAPYDIWDAPITGGEYPDPFVTLNRQFSGSSLRSRANANFSFMNVPRYNRALARAARLSGAARLRAYARLDAQLAREAAPLVAYTTANNVAFVARTIGCVTMTPVYGVSLGSVCRRRR
ncbi:MAG: hypothetical protein ICV64_06950 [Thermoleophilia bacterium]|nr:hypothetical protein [Thermoleophilia bacterium]